MQVSNICDPGTFAIVLIVAVIGLGSIASWYMIKANRVGESEMLARWARETGSQIIEARRLFWMGGRRVPVGFRVTIYTEEGLRLGGVLKFPWSADGERRGTFLPYTSPE